MKTIRKLSWLMLLVLVSSMVLTACGGGEDATATPVPAAPTAAPEATEAPMATQPPEPTMEAVEEFECTDEFGCVTVEKGEKLRIATALVISGPNETLGIDSQRGVEIAIEERGKVLGFDIELVAEDGQCSAEGGQTAATKITSDETIVAVVGHNCSSSCTPAAPIYEQAGFTMISPSCTAPALTGAETHVPAFLRTAHNDDVQGAAAAEFAYNVLGARTAATIHDGSPYADQLQQVFADTFVALGGTITAQEAVNVGDTDMRPLLTSIAVDQPDFMYYPIFIAEGGFITAQAKEISGLENTILAGADGMQSPDFVEAAGDAGEGMYFSGPDLTAQVADKAAKFLAAHEAKYGEDPLSVFHSHAYDAANIIFDAIEKVGVLDAEGNLHIGRKALRDAIYGTTNFPGITGNLTCDENGDCADPAINVVQLQGGAYVPVWSAKEGVIGEMAEIGTVVIGTNAEYPPFEVVDAAGDIVGFDVDLMNAIADAAGFEFEFVNTKWDGIFVALASGEFDAVISAATITDERKETVDFSDPYFNAGQVIVVQASNTDITSPTDLDGKKAGVQLGTTGDIWLTDSTGAEVVRYDENTLAFQALATGEVDAAVADSTTAIEIVNANPEMGLKVLPDVYTDEFYGIAVTKDKPEILAAINEGLAAVQASGEYDAIYEKWFGEEEAMAGLMSVTAPSCDYGGKIKDITALDELTVQFTMCKPDPAFLAKAAFTPFGIQPKEWIEETGGSGELLEHPIGTGPYVLDAWNRGESVVFKRFDDYWGEPAIADTVVFRWATEGAARLLELQSGNVDQITNVSPDDFETVKADPNLQLLPVANPNVLYLAMTNTFEPFDDVRVRQAVAMGIDRQRVVDFFYPEGSTVPTHFTPCSIPNGCTGDPWYDFDPEAARALLAEAGYPDGFQTSIFYRDVFRGYLPEPALVAVEFQAQLKENLGIDAEVVVMESGEFIDESTQGRLDGLYLLGWGADYPHVTNFLDFHFSATNPQFGDPHPEIYEVLEEASQIGDAAAAEALYVQANNAIRELVPMVPIAHGTSAQAALAGVQTHARPFGAVVAAKVDPGKDTFVFMQNAEPISLYCGDETDGESLAPCEQVVEPLLAYALDSGDTIPALATSCEANADSTVWTCFLREGVKFHDGSDFDATDVVASWAAGIDAANPYHVGNTGAFEYFSYLWDGLMNAEE